MVQENESNQLVGGVSNLNIGYFLSNIKRLKKLTWQYLTGCFRLAL